MAKGKHLTEEVKNRIIALAKDGVDLRSLMVRFDLVKSTIVRIKKEAGVK